MVSGHDLWMRGCVDGQMDRWTDGYVSLCPCGTDKPTLSIDTRQYLNSKPKAKGKRKEGDDPNHKVLPKKVVAETFAAMTNKPGVQIRKSHVEGSCCTLHS